MYPLESKEIRYLYLKAKKERIIDQLTVEEERLVQEQQAHVSCEYKPEGRKYKPKEAAIFL